MTGGRAEGSDRTDRVARRPTGHRRRRTARRLAVDLLYQADVMDRAPWAVLAEWEGVGRRIPDYARELIAGVEQAIEHAQGKGWRSPDIVSMLQPRTTIRIHH